MKVDVKHTRIIKTKVVKDGREVMREHTFLAGKKDVEVPKELKDNHFFQLYLKAGDMVPAGEMAAEADAKAGKKETKKVIDEAKAQAKTIVEEAKVEAENIIADATAEAESILANAGGKGKGGK